MAGLPLWPRSLPWRLAGWYLLIFGSLVILLSAVELLALRQILVQNAVQGLRSDLSALPAQLGPHPTTGELAAQAYSLLRLLGGPKTPARISSAAGGILAQSPAAAAWPMLPTMGSRGQAAPDILSVGGRTFLVVQIPLGPPSHSVGSALMARDLDGVLRPLGGAATAWAAGTVAAMLLALFLALPLARRSLLPLHLLAARTQHVAAGDFGTPLPVPDTEDEVASLTKAFNTMTHDLAEAFAQERHTQERMRRFLADASHELRTPLAAINGYIELLRSGHLTPADRDRALEVMEREGTRMAKLVADLLTLSRLDQGLHPPKSLLALAPLAWEVCTSLLPLAATRQLLLQEDDPGWIMGDADSLRRILLNLLDNALRYTPPEESITIRIAANGELSVIDHGPGIDPADLPHIFERFFRGDPARSRSAGGSGLGLAIVESLVTEHGGRVEVDSAAGRGATFTLHFPPCPPPDTA